MIREYFDDLVKGIEGKLAADPKSSSPRKIYALEVARLGRQLYGEGTRVAWCGVSAPFDLLAAMGVTSCFVEFVGAMLASIGLADTFLEEAEHAGFAGDTCAYHRSVIGAARKGMMPVPDFLVATSSPCTGGLAVMENLAKHFEKDLFVLNVPQEPTENGVRYLADQIKEMAAFVSAHTGEALDDEKLRTAIAHTNEARRIMGDVYKLVRQVPSPANGHVLGNFGIVIALLLGTRAAVDVAQAYYDGFAQNVEEGIAGVPGEQIRLLWIQNRIQFKNPVVSLLEDQYKAAIIADELNEITWDAIDPEDPYVGLAKRAISIPFNGQGGRRIKHLQQMASDYRIDGAINPCHWGCRQGTGARGLISQGLKKIGVPVLNLEVDCVDIRNFAEGQIRTRIEAFAEMLENRPSPWS
jgi:benzoyl-CoA reductase/2-hydroxyglutaryl-CoA dehydratase subunit BcrC/BadD/HgdB